MDAADVGLLIPAGDLAFDTSPRLLAWPGWHGERKEYRMNRTYRTYSPL